MQAVGRLARFKIVGFFVSVQVIPKTNRKARKGRKELRKIRFLFNSLSYSLPKTNPDLNS
jgi:hypothetical protein